MQLLFLIMSPSVVANHDILRVIDWTGPILNRTFLCCAIGDVYFAC